MNDDTKTITVGQLRDELRGYPDDALLYFGSGDLEYNRIKNRAAIGEYMAQVEFSTVYRVDHDLIGE